ncbi:MAG TPA: radical SAM protein [Blastocatellia bacterium]|nr:radical SAM protein [Blastocatellia bacterium]
MIIPAWNEKDLFPDKLATSARHLWQPLGILYVAAQLERDGHEVRFIDGALHTHQSILDEFVKMSPRFVGIYSNMPIWNIAKRTIHDLKQLNPDVFISVGGPTAIGWGQRCLVEAPELDCVHTGEGESSAPGVLEHIEGKRRLSEVPGIVYRDESGEIRANPNAPPIKNLDDVAFPARHLLEDVKKYRPILSSFRKEPVFTIFSSRGCTHRCLFCFQAEKVRGVRFRTARNVVDEIQDGIERLGAREYKFLDDLFTVNHPRVFEICKEIKRRGLKFPWFVSGRVDTVNKRLLSAMREAGCYGILFGVESGVQKNLDMLRKGQTVEQIRRAVRDAKSVGMKVNTPFIFGIPGETFEEGLETIDFAIELNGDIANFHTLAPYPGTELYDHVDRYGMMSENYEDYTFEAAGFVPYTMTREQVLQLKELAFKKFYRRPGYMVEQLLKVRSKYELQALLTGAMSLARIHMSNNVFVGHAAQKGRFKGEAVVKGSTRD